MYVEDFDEPRTTLEDFFSALLRSFGCDPIRRQRRSIDLLRRKISVPNKFPFEPLACCPLISHPHTYLVLIPLQLLHPPLTQSGATVAFIHRTHMLSHRLKYGGIPLRLMSLHQRQGFGGPAIGDRIQGWRLYPKIIEYAQDKHDDNGIVNDLHNTDDDCGPLTEE